MRNTLPLIAAVGAANLVAQPALAEDPKSPAEGFNIHVVAPHRHEDGTVHGPYHHYCKSIKPEVLQCMIFLSSDPNAELVEIEYFGTMEQALARPQGRDRDRASAGVRCATGESQGDRGGRLPDRRYHLPSLAGGRQGPERGGDVRPRSATSR